MSQGVQGHFRYTTVRTKDPVRAKTPTVRDNGRDDKRPKAPVILQKDIQQNVKENMMTETVAAQAKRKQCAKCQ